MRLYQYTADNLITFSIYKPIYGRKIIGRKYAIRYIFLFILFKSMRKIKKRRICVYAPFPLHYNGYSEEEAASGPGDLLFFQHVHGL